MVENRSIATPRWQDYVLTQGKGFSDFWSSHLQHSRDILFVLGSGFDPRMCLGLDVFMNAGGLGHRHILTIAFEEGPLPPSPVQLALAAQNRAELQRLVPPGILTERCIPLWSEDKRRRVGASHAVKIFKTVKDVIGYSDLVVDISALPRGIYFPLIAKILYILDGARSKGTPHLPNLHVVVSEDPELDWHIRDEGVEDAAEYLTNFQGGAAIQGDNTLPMVWIPLLGEGQQAQLERIADLVGSAEVCPVLPSPSRDPRRGDNLVLEYQNFLFDQLQIEPGNIIFASEWNPFEVYRQIRKTIFHYHSALAPLGGCKSVLSALSTKLMSLGVLLVAYELKQTSVGVAVAHVESRGYTVVGEPIQTPYVGSKLYGLWLWGECYEP